MTRVFSPRRLFAAALLTGALLAGSSSPARAGHTPHDCWKTIVTVQTVERAVVSWTTRYDHCGKPYRVKVVSYETIEVPVTKTVKIHY